MDSNNKSYRCLICGYVHVGSEPPKECPICGSSPNEFEAIREKPPVKAAATAHWRCLNCEHVHHGANPPDRCPVCGVTREKFEPFTPPEIGKTAVDERKRFVVIGGGIAGLAAAEEIRKNSGQAEILLLSTEKVLPYYRLNLTRYLAGEVKPPDLMIHPNTWYEENRITVRLETPVKTINREKREVVLENGQVLPYDRLILAMGAHPFIPPMEGSTLKNVLAVRTLADAEFILDRLSSIKTCVCIGGGILGLEAAGAIARRGLRVILLEGAPWLMPRQLNQKGSAVLKSHLTRLGIEVREGVRIKEIYGSDACEGVSLETGEKIPGGLVLVTAGVRPNTALARKIGLEVNQGVVVDNHLRTNDANILAAGDITEHYGTVYGLWNISQYQGRIAGLNAVGLATEFGGIPRSNVLKVLNIDLFSIGEFMPRDGSFHSFEQEDGERYSQVVVKDGRLTGGIVIGNMKLSTAIKTAIEQGTEFPETIFTSFEEIQKKLLP